MFKRKGKLCLHGKNLKSTRYDSRTAFVAENTWSLPARFCSKSVFSVANVTRSSIIYLPIWFHLFYTNDY